MATKLNILIVDDEPRVRDEIEEFLLSKKYRVFKAGLPSEAFTVLKDNEISIMILDIKLPEISGLDVLSKVKQDFPDLEVIMISGHGDMDTVIQAMRLGATDYFPKPFRLLDIHSAIMRTQRFIDLNEKLKLANNAVDILSQKLLKNIGSQLIGDGESMRKMVEMMNRVAQTDNTSVLILGESGTGKELVAHGIHYLSHRSQKSFYSVNCSAIPETLFESEFFGHKKGAFTGAVEDKLGWFEIADNGTLFLDEISDMPLNQQAKLLRVLEERRVSKLGSKQSKHVDVRVIAASNANLESMAEQNKFRLDLFHRLSIFVINIPPLRERVEDIPLLFNHYVNHYAQQMGKKITKVDTQVIELLKRHRFPGNVRELRNIVERSVIMCEGKEILTEHVTFKGKDSLTQDKSAIELPKSQEEQNEIQSHSNGHAQVDFDMDNNEKMLIQKALQAYDNNKAKAADALNITWQSLNRRMKKYGIE